MMSRAEGIIDIHAHILPGIDDGAADWDEARWMLRCAYGQGIRTIIATPHYSHRQDVRKIRRLTEKLKVEAQMVAPDFMIYLGQEILYFDSMAESLREGHALTMAGSRYVLVEFMPAVPYRKLYQAVRKTMMSGYCPVIAHVERYAALRGDGQMEELAATGCRMQMNYQSLEGGLLDHNARWCRRQVLDGRIHLLGTDMHHKGYRTPELSKGMKWLDKHVSEEQITYLTRGGALDILGQEAARGDGTFDRDRTSDRDGTFYTEEERKED